MNGQGVEELKFRIIKAIQVLESRDILLMADILGGSPFNVATQLLTEYEGKNLRVVAGVSMAAIVQAIFMREQMSVGQLAGEVARAGKDGVVDVTAMLEGVVSAAE